MEKLKKFLCDWKEDDLGTKPIFRSLVEGIMIKPDTHIELNERPGISYSFRLSHEHQNDRPLFTMIDVIDNDPKHRWLSVCFFGDMIEDPDELGDLIPGGLLGSDGYCFDITDPDEHLRECVENRIQEAYEHAGSRT